MREPAGLGTELRYVTAEGDAVVTTLGEVDVDRLCGGLPVRRVRSVAGQRHYSGLFWSATNGGHVPYESRLELNRLWLADFDPQVCRIAAQPMWLSGRDGSAVRRHVPDLLLRRRGGGIVVVDVKPQRLVDRPEVAQVLAWTGRLCSAAGWAYEVWCSADEVRLANIRWLGQARRPGLLVPQLLSAVLTAWRPGCTVGELTVAVHAQLPGAGAAGAVRQALWQGLLVADLSRTLSATSVLAEGVALVRSGGC